MLTMKTPVTAVMFDFDGTLSSLRNGWDVIMAQMMIELLGENAAESVWNHINESNGFQTIYQMKWLAEQIRLNNGTAADPLEYKTEFDRRLMEMFTLRRASLTDGIVNRRDFLITGSIELLEALQARGVMLLIASGTDEPDVKIEAAMLGISGYFHSINGAVPGVECSKNTVINGLLSSGIPGERLAVVGDGRIEITVGRKHGARTLGVTRDTAVHNRLVKAGADMIVEDFTDLERLMCFFGYA